MSGTDVARRPASAYDDMSVIGFVEAHKPMATSAEGFAAEIQAMATAAETQPVAQSTKENLQALANMAKQVASAAASMYGSARQAAAADYDRAENPRGGTRSVEQKADVVAAGADGF